MLKHLNPLALASVKRRMKWHWFHFPKLMKIETNFRINKNLAAICDKWGQKRKLIHRFTCSQKLLKLN